MLMNQVALAREKSLEPQFHPVNGRPLKPDWLKVSRVGGDVLFGIKRDLRQDNLFTVCEEARCPNISECWNVGTATFMILGDTCTRGCRFCAVKTGNPGGLLDSNEPLKTALNIQKMKLKYAVITMVDRDDLPDGGASHVAETIFEIKKHNPKLILEILAGDFQGKSQPLAQVVAAVSVSHKNPDEIHPGIEVFAHNIETVKRLTPRVRDARARYDQSLDVLKNAKQLNPQVLTKSALMLGLGEEPEEILQALQDLRQANVDIITIGQYLQPTTKHLSIKRFVHPSEFDAWEHVCKDLGFRGIASGPLVRSSYKASHLFPGSALAPN